MPPWTDKPNTAEPQKPRRRWLQVRLRTLLIVMVLLSIPLGYVGWQRMIVRERLALPMRFGASLIAYRPPRGLHWQGEP